MPTTTHVVRSIQAPASAVFDAVSDIRLFSEAIPHIVEIEFLTEQKTGVGTRFREVRDLNGRRNETVLEVTEFVDNERIRLVTEVHGTTWDTVFTTTVDGPGTRLEMTMVATASSWVGSLMNRVITPMVRKAVEKDMDAVKRYCEAPD